MDHTEHTWKVVPLSLGQMLDVRPDDILEGGLYRRCSTFRGGGGYDQFPYLATLHFGGAADMYSDQFVVQLLGCNLDCSYCYVTRAGVWGSHEKVTTSELVEAFVKSGLPVFHLMGGAPALQLSHWGELIEEIHRRAPSAVFHSDLMLSEGHYRVEDLSSIVGPRCLYALNIKGLTPSNWRTNTRKTLNVGLFWNNWRALQTNYVPAYVTFTGVDRYRLDEFWAEAEVNGINSATWRRNSFVIDIIDYNAVSHVDDVPWGGHTGRRNT